MSESNYSKLLKHPEWQKKRLEILNRDNFTCRLCGDTETTLHVHHFEYSKVFPWNIESDKLITLCEYCHNIVEKLNTGLSVKLRLQDFKHGIIKASEKIEYVDNFIIIFVYFMDEIIVFTFDNTICNGYKISDKKQITNIISIFKSVKL